MADSGAPSPAPRCLSPSSRSRRRFRRAEVAAEGAGRRLRGAEVAADGACRRVRPVEVGADGVCRRVRPVEVHAPPLSVGGLTPQSPEEVGTEMGNNAVRAPRRSSAKRSANLERASQVRRMRDRGHTGRRFGDELSPGISKRVVSSDYDADFGLSHVDSFGNSLSASDKENVRPGSKRILDDAMFEFFRKEAVKSLKRDFAKFCNEAVIISKSKRVKEHVIGRDSFTSYSLKYFSEILKSLTKRRKDVIRKFGFGCLLLLEKSEIPSTFVRWICSCVDHVSHQIVVDYSKRISISKHSIHHVIGLPNFGCVPMPDYEAGAKFILSMFGLAELPHITFFGNKLKSREVLTDKEVFVCFMVIAFKCFLVPTSNELPNTDYLSILQEPESASSFDFCNLVFEHLISGVYKYNMACKLNGKAKVFEFSYYILAVYYLDSLDFGTKIPDQSAPRISVWNGNLISFFSDLDRTKNNVFGKTHLKKSLPSCYIEDFSKCDKDASTIYFEPASISLAFKKNSHLRFGSTLEGKIIDGIIEAVQYAITAQHRNVSKAELCVTNVLEFLKNLKSEPNLVTREATIPNCDVIPNSVASPDGKMKISPKRNSDIASKLGFINQHELLQRASNDAVDNNFIEVFESPECVMTNKAEQNSVTAPAMPPVCKVMSRFPHSVCEDQVMLSSRTNLAGGKDSAAFPIHDKNNDNNDVHQSISFGGFVVENNITSPISKINFSQCFVDKDVSGIQMSRGVTVEKKTCRNSTISGSKAAPILVAENSPKPILNSPKVNNGSKDFRFRQVELASKSDELYNKLNNNVVQKDIHPPTVKSQIDNNLDQYIDLSQHVAEEKFPKDDIIILQPKNSLELPLLQNRRFPVTNDDVKNFCSIVELAYTKGVQKSCSVKFSKVHCSFISLGQSLQREGHVDNFLIPVFCRKLFEDNHPSKSGRHHFFSFIGENILDYNNEVQLGLISKAFLGAASASKGKRLELSDMLFFPICRSRHWFTFSVNFKFKLFIFLDSLYNQDDEFHTSIKNVLINNFVKLWQLIFQTEENIFRKFSIMYAKVPKQGNVDDCGVFTMKFMEIFKPEVDTCSLFCKEDIIHIRIQIANQLFFCKRNNVDKSVVLNYKIQA